MVPYTPKRGGGNGKLNGAWIETVCKSSLTEFYGSRPVRAHGERQKTWKTGSARNAEKRKYSVDKSLRKPDNNVVRLLRNE